MALNDVPLNDAGRDYYNQQFGARVQNIRKYGATPPSPRNAGCLGTGGAAGGGLFAIIVVIRIIAAVAWVGSSSYDSDSNYNNYTPPTFTVPDPPPQVDWQNNLPVDPPKDPNGPNWNPPLGQPDQPPFILPPLDPPVVAPPDDPPVAPDPPLIVPPNDPPAVPDPPLIVPPNDPPAVPDPPADPPAAPGDGDK